jgi:Tol biopolymer transport system component
LLTKPDASTMNIGTGALSPPLPTGVEGTYTLSATSTDKAGNTRTSQTTYTVGTSAIGTIVFARGGDIWSIKPDGTDLRQITSGAPIDEQPTKTPSGDRIVFARGPVGSRQLYSIDPDGQNLVGPLTSGGDNTAPAFSPDGTKLAFESTRTGSKDRDIWTAVYTTTGTSLASYFNASNAKGSDVTPAWSPSGTKIAFASNRPEKFEIFTMLATGGKQVQLTRNKKNDVDPSYLPDGRITFSSNQSKGGPANKQEIFVMHADGTSQLRLTKIMGFDRAPLYFDAANGIVFQSATFGGGGLAKVAPAGGTVTKIPNTIPNDATPG